MFFLWMVIVMFYFALLLGDLPGSVIFNNAVNGGMEGLGALFGSERIIIFRYFCHSITVIQLGSVRPLRRFEN